MNSRLPRRARTEPARSIGSRLTCVGHRGVNSRLAGAGFRRSVVNLICVGHDAKYLYAYAMESNGGATRKAPVAKAQANCCSVTAPIGSECIICGNIV